MTRYDAIVIGSGQAGTPLSKKLAGAGFKTALIEKKWIGGTCINDGCTPTKTLIASARMAYTTQNSEQFGINIPEYSIDFKRIMQRQADIVSLFRQKSARGVESTPGLDLIFGQAEFIASHSLKVTLEDGSTDEFTAEKIFIDTGSRPRIPEIKGLDSIEYLTSTSILDLHTLPQHLLIVGGGYIGLEYGQMFRRFGSKVTIIDSSHRFLPREDEDIALEILKILEDDGIEIYTSSEIQKLEKPGKLISLLIQKNGQEINLNGSHLLMATGRTPQTDLLKTQAAGIQVNERGFIETNDKLETNIPGIYALGESNGGPAFTHISYNDFIIVSKNLLENSNLSIKGRPMPYCMFTDPPLARIGLTETEARQQGHNIKVAKLPVKNVARALQINETRGLIKAVVDAKSKLILGAAVLAYEGGELMAVFQMAMKGKITYEQLQYEIFAHPTFSESLNNLFMNLDDKT
ncbi:MAG TPA: mercuric reductase [Daejeonella sp.]|nr:mercuric reductase [Daejeonella sp.]